MPTSAYGPFCIANAKQGNIKRAVTQHLLLKAIKKYSLFFKILGQENLG
ncbi:hypothetical protein LDG_6715 [Legionella drancourtii LLAP12]|uniref:Uncharacterized protein n=1 Tax=Legionella drancourtii LLAP12 TaxID=658187 RepID=G9EN94_9GAMM|nr:hypothetical protein LDG_6715 [Legionella drancourtii LLAP12]